MTFSESERRRQEGSLPPRSVVVTFDDGYASTVRAGPILDRFGFPGTVFVVTSFVDSQELMSWEGVAHWLSSEHAANMQPLSWPSLGSLVERGWEIGSHTVTHPRLPFVDDEQLAYELETSRQAIVDRLGSCKSIAYPYGLANATVAHAAARAGYLAGATLSAAHRVDEPLRRPRVGIYAGDTGIRLRAKMSPIVNRTRRMRTFALLAGARTRIGVTPVNTR